MLDCFRDIMVKDRRMRVVFVAHGQQQLGLSMLSAVLRDAGHEKALAFNPALFQAAQSRGVWRFRWSEFRERLAP